MLCFSSHSFAVKEAMINGFHVVSAFSGHSKNGRVWKREQQVIRIIKGHVILCRNRRDESIINGFQLKRTVVNHSGFQP